MIDIHSHLLPGIDDGAPTLADTLELLRHAVADGISHIVFTPHIQPGVYNNNRQTIESAFGRVEELLELHGLGLVVAMAAEVRLCPEILEMVALEQVPLFKSETGQSTMLLELPHSHVPPGTEQMIRWLRRQGIEVLIAHPERNKDLIRKPELLQKLKAEGCMMQLTAGSIAGYFGGAVQGVAEYILKQGWCDLIASDAHNLRHRPPQLSDGVAAASAIVGANAARDLVWTNPMSIASGMFI